jgi:two-component sensor histidine kinase
MKIPLFEVIEVRDAGRVRLRLRGQLDLAGAPTLSERLRRLRERGAPVVRSPDNCRWRATRDEHAQHTDLPRSPDSVGAARRHVSGHTASLGPQQRQHAILMVSELVTNAVHCGVGAISLRIDAGADAVRIVADEGNVALPPSPQPSAQAAGG